MSEVMIFDQVIQHLNEANVDYIIVGGLAVLLHGYVRMTADLDIVPELSESNLSACIDALEAMGYKPRLPVKAEELLDPQKRKKWIESKNLIAFTFINPKSPLSDVDLLIHSPVPFETLWANKKKFQVATQTLYGASIDNLIKMKQASNRPIDIRDIEALQEIKRKTGP